MQKRTHVLRPEAVWSYREQHGLKRVWGNGQAIFAESQNVTFDRFPDVLDGLFARFSLANAAR